MSSRARQIRNEKRNTKPKSERFYLFKVGETVKLNRGKEQSHYSRYQTMFSYYGKKQLTVIAILDRDDNGPDDHPQKIKVTEGGLYEEGDWFLPIR